MKLKERIDYFKYLFRTYLLRKEKNQLDFWYGVPQINRNAEYKNFGPYYMTFFNKAHYPGPFDEKDIPLLDYGGNIGKQYHPTVISQYALGHYNLFKEKKDKKHFDIFINQANWLVNNLASNSFGALVWYHNFNWYYHQGLKAPWCSALAQGQGLSVLCRAFKETKKEKFLNAAKKVFLSFTREIDEGGIRFTDKNNNIWLEKYIISPPTHILNGFIWSLWGVYDYFLLTKEILAKDLFDNCVKTLENNLNRYDLKFWSLYDLSNTIIRPIASPFYHRLHIAQLRIMYEMTGKKIFKDFAERWQKYQENFIYKNLAILYKILFKIFYW